MAEVEELRVQPQDILAEQSVLGAIFIDESKLVFVREYIESRDFFKYAHRLIFQAMVDLSDRGDAIDATTVRTILDNQTMGILKKVPRLNIFSHKNKLTLVNKDSP